MWRKRCGITSIGVLSGIFFRGKPNKEEGENKGLAMSEEDLLPFLALMS